jgi:hypothetical protein
MEEEAKMSCRDVAKAPFKKNLDEIKLARDE